MDIGSVLNMATALQTQQLNQAKMESEASLLKDSMEFHKNMVAQLLSSLPSVNPDGVGSNIDITV
jgi:hypothetical protein